MRVGRASMRPRVFPAEDSTLLAAAVAAVTAASMRPRVFPAEDVSTIHDSDSGTHASMRPRVFPAED